MFCKKCGTQMDDNAKFCPKCGTPANGESSSKSENTVIEDNTVKFQLKPTFNWPYKILKAIGTAILVILIILLYSFGEFDLDSAEEVSIYFILMAIVFGISLVVIFIKLIFENIQYKHLSYNFYATKVEYIDGFLNREEKELKYKFIREVTMSQNIFERIFKIGTVRIFTNASSGSYYQNTRHGGMANKNGIVVHCVKNVREQYEKVKEIVDAGTTDND